MRQQCHSGPVAGLCRSRQRRPSILYPRTTVGGPGFVAVDASSVGLGKNYFSWVSIEGVGGIRKGPAQLQFLPARVPLPQSIEPPRIIASASAGANTKSRVRKSCSVGREQGRQAGPRSMVSLLRGIYFSVGNLGQTFEEGEEMQALGSQDRSILRQD